jgi:hypothetical protein
MRSTTNNPMKLTTITIALVAGTALTALCGAARGEEDIDTGNWWVQNCRPSTALDLTPRQLTSKEKEAIFNQAICVYYVRGFAHALMLWEATERNTAPICIPVEVKINQLLDVALNYLQAHPEQRHKRMVEILGDVLYDAFPCKKKN